MTEPNDSSAHGYEIGDVDENAMAATGGFGLALMPTELQHAIIPAPLRPGAVFVTYDARNLFTKLPMAMQLVMPHHQLSALHGMLDGYRTLLPVHIGDQWDTNRRLAATNWARSTPPDPKAWGL